MWCMYTHVQLHLHGFYFTCYCLQTFPCPTHGSMFCIKSIPTNILILHSSSETFPKERFKHHCTKADVLENMQILQSKVHSCTDNDILKAANTNIKAALSIITASEKHKPCVTVETKKHPPPNTNHDKQPVFHSTKKKRRTSTQPLAKPTCEELKEARKILDNTYVRVCGECHKEDDKEDVDVVQWIECSSCSLWIHTKYAQSTSNACNDTFLCKYCL